MKQFKIFTLLLLSAIAMISCKDDDPHMHSDVTIEFMKPTAGEVIENGADTVMVHIHIEMTSEETIHHVEISMQNETSSEVVYDFSDHVHEEDGSYSHHADVEVVVSAHSDFSLQAIALDHDMMEVTNVTRDFHVHP